MTFHLAFESLFIRLKENEYSFEVAIYDYTLLNALAILSSQKQRLPSLVVRGLV